MQEVKLTRMQLRRLEEQTCIGKVVKHREKGGDLITVMGTVVDEVHVMVGDYKHLLQRIEFAPGQGWDGQKVAYRTGYYTYDRRGRRIVWGQYHQFVTEWELRTLLTKARRKGWRLFS